MGQQRSGGHGLDVSPELIANLKATFPIKELMKAEKACLRSAANVITREGVKTFLRNHPHRPTRGKARPRVYAVGLGDGTYMGFSQSAFAAAGKRKAGRVGKVRLSVYGLSIKWWPSFLLDWFENGTEVRVVKNTWRRVKTREGKRAFARKLQNGFRGSIKAEPFLSEMITAKLTLMVKVMERSLTRAMERMGKKK